MSVVLHAAAVSDLNGDGFLILGAPGSGKTTLTFFLTSFVTGAKRFAVVGDESLRLLVEDMVVEAIPRGPTSGGPHNRLCPEVERARILWALILGDVESAVAFLFSYENLDDLNRWSLAHRALFKILKLPRMIIPRRLGAYTPVDVTEVEKVVEGALRFHASVLSSSRPRVTRQ